MLPTSLWLPLLALVLSHATAAAPGSCVGRCGETFTRGQRCTCDFGCQAHNECCPDFQATCLTAQSCRGRCGEAFRRGRVCECDPQCVSYNTCCPDYQLQCQADVPGSQNGNLLTLRAVTNRKGRSKKKQRSSNSESEEEYTGRRGLCRQHAGGRCPGAYDPLPAGHAGSPPLVLPNNPLQYAAGYGSAHDQPVYWPHAGSADSPRVGSPPAGRGASSSSAAASGTAGGNAHVPLVHTARVGVPAGPHPENLCSDPPIDGLTALSNGTIVVFKGGLFWLVDPVSRSQGPPQSIADTLGVPSPVDAAFTRCNCHGTVYIIKGGQFWRLDENMVREPGYPKPLASEFPGLAANVTAALPFPATGGSPESVLFFRNGDILQRFVFPEGSAPPCKKTPRGSVQGRVARQAEVLLTGEITIRVSAEGLPTPVTSALSMADPRAGHQYQHYVFSGPLFFRVQVSGEQLELFKPDPSTAFTAAFLLDDSAVAATPDTPQDAAPPTPAPANSIRRWLRCP